jgi:hypothetical protein
MPTPIQIIGDFLRREMMEKQEIYEPDMETQKPYEWDATVHDIYEVSKPKQSWDELLLSAKQMAEGAFDLMTNESSGFYIAWEKMSREEELRIKHLLTEYIEKELLERF